MTKWTRRFLGLAKHIAQWSKDESSQVGAVIVDAQNRVVSVGYNGPPRETDDGPFERSVKLRRTLHAETNALLFAHRDLAGCTIYVTHPPCAQCAAKIVQTGIAHVVYPAPSDAFRERWQDDIREARAMFCEALVVVQEEA